MTLFKIRIACVPRREATLPSSILILVLIILLFSFSLAILLFYLWFEYLSSRNLAELGNRFYGLRIWCKERRGKRFHGLIIDFYSLCDYFGKLRLLYHISLFSGGFLLRNSLLLLNFSKSSGRTGVWSWRLIRAAVLWRRDTSTAEYCQIIFGNLQDPFFLYYFLNFHESGKKKGNILNVIKECHGIIAYYAPSIIPIKIILVPSCLETARAHASLVYCAILRIILTLTARDRYLLQSWSNPLSWQGWWPGYYREPPVLFAPKRGTEHSPVLIFDWFSTDSSPLHIIRRQQGVLRRSDCLKHLRSEPSIREIGL